MFDGLRLVSLAQEACAARGLDAARHLAIIRHDRVATFLLKKTPFSAADVVRLERLARDLGFTMLYAPGVEPPLVIQEPIEMQRMGTSAADYRRLILAADREAFHASYPLDVRATDDDRPFFFHTTRLRNQFQVAFGRSMLFGNGLSALLTLMGISATLVVLFIIAPLLIGGGRPEPGWGGWLVYFAALGAGFMLLEVALLQRFVLLLGHPVFSLTVTLFALLLGTGLGSLASRRVAAPQVRAFALKAMLAIAAVGVAAIFAVPSLIDFAIAWPLPARLVTAAVLMTPAGVLLGVPLPSGMRLLAAATANADSVGLGMNGAFSVVGATLAVFIAMNWGFSATLLAAASCTRLLPWSSRGGPGVSIRGRDRTSRSRSRRTFDDFLFTPQYSVLERRDPSIDLSSRFSEHLTLKRPIVSANMDTITRAEMAIAVAEEGGIGVIDRGFRAGDIEPQVREVENVKRRQHGIITDPYTIAAAPAR